MQLAPPLLVTRLFPWPFPSPVVGLPSVASEASVDPARVVTLVLTALGVAIGVAGAAYGARATLRRAKGPNERAFAIRAIVGWSLGVALFLGVQWSLPRPWGQLLWVVYALGMVWGIRVTNRAASAARAQDELLAGGGLGERDELG